MHGIWRAARAAASIASKPHLKIAERNSGTWCYRTAPPVPDFKHKGIASLLGGIMWWWVLWHFWTEPEHITGEYPKIDPLEWTDEELGIPPDSEGLGGRAPMLYPK